MPCAVCGRLYPYGWEHISTLRFEVLPDTIEVPRGQGVPLYGNFTALPNLLFQTWLLSVRHGSNLCMPRWHKLYQIRYPSPWHTKGNEVGLGSHGWAAMFVQCTHLLYLKMDSTTKLSRTREDDVPPIEIPGKCWRHQFPAYCVCGMATTCRWYLSPCLQTVHQLQNS